MKALSATTCASLARDSAAEHLKSGLLLSKALITKVRAHFWISSEPKSPLQLAKCCNRKAFYLPNCKSDQLFHIKIAILNLFQFYKDDVYASSSVTLSFSASSVLKVIPKQMGRAVMILDIFFNIEYQNVTHSYMREDLVALGKLDSEIKGEGSSIS